MNIFYPSVMTSTNGIDHSSDIRSELFYKNRIIIIDGEIDGAMATAVNSQIMYLNRKSNDNIYILIDSPGGSVSSGYRIYDCIKGCACPVVTVVNGVAASMAALILAAGEKGRRYATKNSEVMIHQPLGGIQGQATEMIIAVNHIMSTKEKITKILALECGKSVQRIAHDIERDYWMDSREAKEYGIVDKIGFPAEIMEA